MALSRGTRLGPYEILGPLGAGGLEEVYLSLTWSEGSGDIWMVHVDQPGADSP